MRQRTGRYGAVAEFASLRLIVNVKSSPPLVGSDERRGTVTGAYELTAQSVVKPLHGPASVPRRRSWDVPVSFLGLCCMFEPW